MQTLLLPSRAHAQEDSSRREQRVICRDVTVPGWHLLPATTSKHCSRVYRHPRCTGILCQCATAGRWTLLCTLPFCSAQTCQVTQGNTAKRSMWLTIAAVLQHYNV